MDYLDLAQREAAAGITAGTPFVFSPSYNYDRDLVRYFNTGSDFVDLNAATRDSEAREIKTWLSFLDSQEVHWLDAVDQHFTDFRRVRTDADVVRQLLDDDQLVTSEGRLPVVTLATFAKGHIALRRLYKWAVGQRLIRVSPIPDQTAQGTRATKKKSVKPDWLMPGSYQLWRNVGLGGHRLDQGSDGRLEWGVPDESWKGGVNATRNQAFTNLMITSALRRREQSTLLEEEVPAPGRDARVPTGVAKFNRSRVYTPSAAVIAEVAAYQRFHRTAAVQRAKDAGRYDAMAADDDLLVLSQFRRDRDALVFVAETGDEIDLDSANQDQRMRMFRRDAEGSLEPMMLWLTEAGRPMSPSGWNDVFDTANDRVAGGFRRIGVTDDLVRANPHVLRFSFALYLLAALHRRIDERENYRETEAYDWRRYGAAYGVVQDMLGHSSEETTVNTYLNPVKGLRQASLFDTTVGLSLEEVIGVLVQGSDRVMRTGSVFEGSV